MHITVAAQEITSQAARELISALNDELSRTYPEAGATHFALDTEEVAPGRGAFLVAYREGAAVGCGAVRLLDGSTAELKRMYVAPPFRGTGIGRRLLVALEDEARRLGAGRIVLETGLRQAAALALYTRSGYEPIPLYGEYCLSPNTSTCFGKPLVDVSLREVRESDLSVLFEHQRDPVASRMAAFESRDRDAFMKHWREKILADETVDKKTVLCDGYVAGNILSFKRSGRREVGYWIAREHWGKGVATEALRRFLREVTERPVFASVAKENGASIRVLEKCGFVIERERRGSSDRGGTVVDEYVLILR